MSVVQKKVATAHIGTSVSFSAANGNDLDTDPVVGNHLLLFISSGTGNSGHVSVPAGWTQDVGPSASASNICVSVLRKQVEASDGLEYTFSLLGVADDIVATLIEENGLSGATPEDKSGVAASGSGAATLAVAASAAIAQAIEICYALFGESGSGQTWDGLVNGGFVLEQDNDDQSAGHVVVRKITSAIETPGFTITYDSTGRIAAVIVTYLATTNADPNAPVLGAKTTAKEHVFETFEGTFSDVDDSVPSAVALRFDDAGVDRWWDPDNRVLSASEVWIPYTSGAISLELPPGILTPAIVGWSMATKDPDGADGPYAADQALAVAAFAPTIEITIDGTDFKINGALTYPGTVDVEGDLINARCVNVCFDDENPATVSNWDFLDGPWDAWRNTDNFCKNGLPLLAAHGIKMISIGLQGGNPGTDNGTNITSAFNADGSLKAAWKERVNQVIKLADEYGIVVLVSCYYQAQDQILTDAAAVEAGVENVIDWLYDEIGYENVLLEMANEHNVGGFAHTILSDEDLVGQLAVDARTYASTTHGKTIYTTVSKSTSNVKALLQYTSFGTPHGNTTSEVDGGVEFEAALDDTLGSAEFTADPQPLCVNEDSIVIDKMEAALLTSRSSVQGWGYHDQDIQHLHSDGPPSYTEGAEFKTAFLDRALSFSEDTGAVAAGFSGWGVAI